jgi:hypothetical protein
MRPVTWVRRPHVCYPPGIDSTHISLGIDKPVAVRANLHAPRRVQPRLIDPSVATQRFSHRRLNARLPAELPCLFSRPPGFPQPLGSFLPEPRSAPFASTTHPRELRSSHGSLPLSDQPRGSATRPSIPKPMGFYLGRLRPFCSLAPDPFHVRKPLF